MHASLTLQLACEVSQTNISIHTHNYDIEIFYAWKTANSGGTALPKGSPSLQCLKNHNWGTSCR